MSKTKREQHPWRSARRVNPICTLPLFELPAKLPWLEPEPRDPTWWMRPAPKPLRPEPATTRKRDRPACGAKTRKGTPCVAKAVWDKQTNMPRNGRCRLHGGLSTGVRTDEGREKIREVARAAGLARNAPRGPDGRFLPRSRGAAQTS
jgi:hypothetical protein